jgi:hypothetical protein
MAAAKAQKKQAQEVQSWTKQQSQFRQQEQARQEGMRQEASAAQQQGLEAISAENQAKRQTEEEQRLAAYLEGQGEAAQPTGTTPVSEADKAMLTGQQGGDTEFKADMAKKINEASKTAKQRIGALARVASFGESFGGLGTTNPLLQQATGSAIDRQNEFRRGSLGAYNVERAIDPVQVTYTPSPMADVFSTALSFGAQGLGNLSGSGKGAGSLFGGGKAATKTIPTKSGWAGLRKTGNFWKNYAQDVGGPF